MDYRQANKEAWEAAYANRHPGWGDNHIQRLIEEPHPFLGQPVLEALEGLELAGKSVAQFCCNNGRELLSLMKLGPARGVGFDIAENMVARAREISFGAGIPCEFVATDILEIGGEYDGAFDLALVTIGAMCWFKSLDDFFGVISRTLRPGATLLVHETHPVTTMLAYPGDEKYREGEYPEITHDYFSKEPWTGHSMDYLSGEILDKTFTDYSHPISEVVNGLVKNGMVLTGMEEYDVDIGLGDCYDHRGVPLSILYTARKTG